MRITRLSLLSVTLAAGLGFLPGAVAKDLELINFLSMFRNADGTYEKSYQYTFGDWQGPKKVAQIPQKGLLVNLVGSKGGLGDNVSLELSKHSKVRITFMIGNRNAAKAFTFSLVDRDGTDQAFEVSLGGRSVGMETRATVDLSQPTREEKPGKTPGLDLKKLKSWQLKGDFGPDPLELLFLRLDAVGE